MVLLSGMMTGEFFFVTNAVPYMNESSKMKVALYARVSKQEQNPDMQKNSLIVKAEREGWDLMNKTRYTQV
ncbi:MAG: recombinase family protein [Thermoplasmata archaeon]|nr:recombinase family protein [Thermoplasmata archaeon]